ncbi:MAG: hypothetical protein KatS3mg118_2926 [Paracoccaceae bacterium]|nr:MAG: hypothetical protein KatS3mg118_2926 [Paracoccaceae bacterium]
MAKKMLIDATHPEETRVVVVDGNKVEEFDFESINKKQIAGNIYLAKVTRVEPSLQAAFVDFGGNRHGFLAFSEIHPDYYQIPVADREALLAEQAAEAEAEQAEEDEAEEGRPRGGKRRRRGRARAAAGQAPAEAAGDAPAAAAEGDAPGDAPAAAEDPAGPEVMAESAPADPAISAEPAEAAEIDEVESVAAEDMAEEIATRRPPSRRYRIQEVIKVRQIMLVQVVKEERGNKGAALTTYLSLRRALLRADAQHRPRRRHQPQDHQRRRPQEAARDRRRARRAQGAGPDRPHRRRRSAPRPRSSATTNSCCASGSRSATDAAARSRRR